MRMLVLFALTLVGTAVITEDASAFGKRGRRGAASACCGSTYGGAIPSGSYGSGYAPSPSCCGGSGMAGGYGSYSPQGPGYVYPNGAIGQPPLAVQGVPVPMPLR